MAENSRAFNPFAKHSFVVETLSSLSSDPLFLTIFTFYTLILLYFPSLFLNFALSPVPISAAVILLSLLRFGAAQSPIPRETENSHDGSSNSIEFHSTLTQSQQINHDSDSDAFTITKHGFASRVDCFADSFVEWDVRAPLEVIYEEYDEGQEAGDDNDAVCMENRESQMNMIIQRYASLSSYYPESDTDNSSEGDSTAILDCDFPEKSCFRWEDEDDRDGLIEIALDEKRISETEEDNLIEIDLSEEAAWILRQATVGVSVAVTN